MNSVNVKIPNPGSRVRVTTKHRNIYYLNYQTKPFNHFTYEGIVLPSEKRDHPFTFNMTGDSQMTKRNISLDNVVNIEFLSGSASMSKMTSDIRAFKVKTENKVYTVIKNANKYTCDCLGFQYRKNCRHVKGVHAKLSA